MGDFFQILELTSTIKYFYTIINCFFMKKIFCNTLIFSLLISFSALAQTEEKTSLAATNVQADLSLAAGTGFSPSLFVQALYGIGKSKKFKIGYGLRFTSFFGSNITATTAPADLTSDENKVDDFVLETAQANFLNTAIVLQYSFSQKFDLGFNIDVLGLTFGGEQHGDFSSKRAGVAKVHSTAKPTQTNVLLVGDNDRGSLNSEFFARYWLNEKWAIKAGASYTFVEYTTKQKMAFDNDRFRHKAMMGMVGITYRLK